MPLHRDKNQVCKQLEIRNDIKQKLKQNLLRNLQRNMEAYKNKLFLRELKTIVRVLGYLVDKIHIAMDRPSKCQAKDMTWTIYHQKLSNHLNSSFKQLHKTICTNADLVEGLLINKVWHAIKKYAIKFLIRNGKPTTRPHTDK